MRRLSCCERCAGSHQSRRRRLCERQLPRQVSAPLFSAYCRAYGVNLEEAEPSVAGYASFDAFFTRTLREGARRISRDALVSPSDGRLSAAVESTPARACS